MKYSQGQVLQLSIIMIVIGGRYQHIIYIDTPMTHLESQLKIINWLSHQYFLPFISFTTNQLTSYS